MSVETLKLNDGRILAFERFGDASGDPVYFFHGFPGSRLQAALVADQAKANGICLVAFDRPGFGQSSRQPSRTILGLSQDVAFLADHLGHKEFGVLGVSCGGPYAMACAIALRSRVVHLGLLGGIGPMDIPEIRKSQMLPLKIMFYLGRLNRWLAAPILALDRAMFLRDPIKAVKSLSKLLSAPDRAMLRESPEVMFVFAESLAEAYRPGIDGAMTEARLIASPHGYDVKEIKVATDLFQAGVDRHVPPEMGRYVADRIEGASYHFMEAEGHLSILVNSFRDYAARFRVALTRRSSGTPAGKPATAP